ncbi:sulfatase [Reichenbachiella carrageenanivorans]|uniref:Sulfatase n=1 Tax=Reichenbachiella carrageenanivorans TaxID=2979869 RepID=A0ABY6CW70_9BACT|nr:sulfatase [Reichenbachiella carrageenanivorans]UXX78113.1 sulfatase [Reichenbachiella carrageenanivorans]
MKSKVEKGVFVLIIMMYASVMIAKHPAEKAPNVLLIMVDDMNDWVGAFGGHPQAITPHMDALAEKSVLFSKAYCSAPLCNPSRTSMLTGYLPSTTQVFGNSEHFRELEGFENTVTLPQYFHANGYKTAASGKIFHSPRGPAKVPKPQSDPGSFEQERRGGLGATYPDQADRFQHGINFDILPPSSHLRKSFDWLGVEVPDEQTQDWQSAEYAAQFLKESHDKPFFLACGIFRPHLPWYAPQQYFDLYDVDQIELPKILATDLDDVGSIGSKIAQKELHDELVRTGNWQAAVSAYLANLSYADACVGHLLDALQASDYLDNTIVVVMGDHGWHLGEKSHWSKNTLWEESAKTPLLIYDPRQKGEAAVCERVVSLIDIYPTLVELCGLPTKSDLDGQSIAPLLKKPNLTWERPALTSKDKKMHSLRSERYRYIVYPDGFEELYDHEVDPMEWNNIASDKKNIKVLANFRKELSAQIKP